MSKFKKKTDDEAKLTAGQNAGASQEAWRAGMKADVTEILAKPVSPEDQTIEARNKAWREGLEKARKNPPSLMDAFGFNRK